MPRHAIAPYRADAEAIAHLHGRGDRSETSKSVRPSVDVLGASIVKPPKLPVVKHQAGQGGDFSYFVCRALRPVGRQVKPVWSLRA